MPGKREAKPEKKQKKTLDIVLIVVASFLAAFILTMIVIFCVKGSTPDVLIQYVLGAGGVEAVLTASITIVKQIKSGNNKEDIEE